VREDLRPGEGLGVLVRQVPRHEVQGHDLRSLWRESHPQPRAAQAHGSHRTRRAGRPHLVLQGDAEPFRRPSRHEDVEPGEGHLFPGLRRPRSQGHAAEEAAAPHRGGVPQGAGGLRRRGIRRRDGRRGRAQTASRARPRHALQGAPRGAPHDGIEAEKEGPRQPAEDRGKHPRQREQAGMDGPRRDRSRKRRTSSTG